MKNNPSTTAEPNGWVAAWSRFWFNPADPLVLGAIRICTGLIALYTFTVYGFGLMDLMGPNAWYDLKMRLEVARERPMIAYPLAGYSAAQPAQPKTPEDIEYFNRYVKETGMQPMPPLPRGPKEAEYSIEYHKTYRMDPRFNGARLPANDKEYAYLENYTRRWNTPPPGYPETEEEAERIDQYMQREGGNDPRRAYALGMPVWSAFFHVTDPFGMYVIHWGLVLVTLLFLLGVGTRVTSVLTWFAGLNYIHRDPACLFGVDTMMNIVMLYLAIGPSGAALSVDRLIARWWSKNKPRVVSRWYALFGRQVNPADVAPAEYHAQPQPSVSANVAIRLLQIHVCIVYLVSGLAKLQGNAWWTHTAIWGTIANYEFAPMQFAWYVEGLRLLGRNQFFFELFMSCGCLFTLAFEIGYAFLIWPRRTRWLFLVAAVILHGFIGMFMGLKTFSLMMLVMNMAFLRTEEVRWALSRVFGADPARRPTPPAPSPEPALAAAGATPAPTGIKRK